MPEEKTPTKTEEKAFPETSKDKAVTAKVVTQDRQPEAIVEPMTTVLSPNSPWEKVHADGVIDTFVMEVRDAGILIRTESPARGSESTVFLPNVKVSQIPSCK
jgi:hypothetical protein